MAYLPLDNIPSSRYIVVDRAIKGNEETRRKEEWYADDTGGVMTYSDEQLFECLEDIDRTTIIRWEASFIESILERGVATFTRNQRAIIERMIQQYLP
jgi:hypothetical protein